MTDTVPRHRRRPWYDTAVARAVILFATWAASWGVLIAVVAVFYLLARWVR